MRYGDLTIEKLKNWELLANSANDLLKIWRKAVVNSNRSSKKNDLNDLSLLQAQIDSSEKALHAMEWEIEARESELKRRNEKIHKLQRYCRALGGDPELIYWHKDSDFV